MLKLTGGINFYQSDVNFERVQINNSAAEDALNIVRSNLKMMNVSVDGARSDAIDIDFSNGTLDLMTFRNIKGDGLDTSGSTVEIGTMRFSNINDKAVSAGEESTLTAKRIDLSNSGKGVVSKDGSVVEVELLNVNDARDVAGMAYNKKDIYDSGSLIVIDSNAPVSAFKAQKLSTIELRGRLINT